MVEVVGHVGEVGSPGLDAFDEGDGFSEVGVAGVRLAAEGVKDEDVEVLEEREAFGGDVAEVGEVGCGAEAVAGDLVVAVGDRDAEEVGSEEDDFGSGRGGDAVDGDAGAGGVAVGAGAEGVVEDALDGGGGGLVGVEREAVGVVEAERAEVVHAEDVVGVAVGVEDGVEAADVLADGLCVEVGAGVDDDVVVVPGDQDGGAGSAVAGVSIRGHCGGADGAVAAQRGDAHGGSTSQKGKGSLHRVLANDAGAAGCAATGGGWWLAVGGGAGEGLGDFEEAHSDFEEGVVHELGLGGV